MNAWVQQDVTLGSGQVVGASQSNIPISKEYRITSWGSLRQQIAVKASAVTVAAGITAKLQTSIDGGTTWVDSKTVAVSANGVFYIKLLETVAGDQTYLPLLNTARVVLTTGAGDTATVDWVYSVQGQ